uniref:Uncharacterized protein n=1 Tax=Rhizophora mucronata TaxID=61149 RepID=A0A2P2QVZ8_RHIMU
MNLNHTVEHTQTQIYIYRPLNLHQISLNEHFSPLLELIKSFMNPGK